MSTVEQKRARELSEDFLVFLNAVNIYRGDVNRAAKNVAVDFDTVVSINTLTDFNNYQFGGNKSGCTAFGIATSRKSPQVQKLVLGLMHGKFRDGDDEMAKQMTEVINSDPSAVETSISSMSLEDISMIFDMQFNIGQPARAGREYTEVLLSNAAANKDPRVEEYVRGKVTEFINSKLDVMKA